MRKEIEKIDKSKNIEELIKNICHFNGDNLNYLYKRIDKRMVEIYGTSINDEHTQFQSLINQKSQPAKYQILDILRKIEMKVSRM